ncbi:MAG: hypothetical protein H6Q16_1069 [Bacteroidetes bacterium]|nr:hypothetical protein [Bacteroidota bacterium]
MLGDNNIRKTNLKILFKQINSSIIDLLFVILLSILILISLSNFSGFVFSNFGVPENPFLNDNVFRKFLKSIFKIVLISSLFNYLFCIILKKESFAEMICKLRIKENYKLKIFLIKGLTKYMFVYFIPMTLFIFNVFNLQTILIYWIILLFIRILFLLIFKQNIFDAIYRIEIEIAPNTDSKRIKISSILISTIIDAGVIYSISYLLHTVLLSFIYTDFFNFLIITWIAYQLLSLIFKGRTFGKLIVGISYKLNNEENNLKGRLLLCALNKIIFVVLIPYIIIYLLGIREPFAIFMNILFFLSYFSLAFYIIEREKFWDKLSGISAFYSNDKISKKVFSYLFLCIILLSSFFISQNINNKIQNNNNKTFGFNYPYLFTQNKNYNSYKEHAEWIKQQPLSAKEYILNLYKKYDVVVLHEKYHQERTQWDFITEVVKDTSFINNVGVIFTEYGSVEHQEKLDSFLLQKFNSEEKLEKETACLMTFMTSGYYYFLKDVNLLNNTLADSLKVRVRFTDNIDWDYFTKRNRMDIPNIENRDSLMAQVVVDWYKKQTQNKQKNKCLVITNYRHAFGYPEGKEIFNNKRYSRLYFGNEAQYLFEAIPNKTANVLQAGAPLNNSRMFFIPLNQPINSGIWDAAFKANNYKQVGFDLAGSPFGNDKFDMYPLRGEKIKYGYKDFFTGLIFDKPYEMLETSGYPYIEYAANREMQIKKSDPKFKSKNIDYSLLKYYKDISSERESFVKSVTFLSIPNYMGIIILILSTALSLLFSTYYLIVKLIKGDKNKTSIE